MFTTNYSALRLANRFRESVGATIRLRDLAVKTLLEPSVLAWFTPLTHR
jgi:hypothetical protein